ncbi:MAG: ABC transporter ATP-binding protein [Hydrogenophaga sp.]|uniref:ABC transporter ATP-binding protein n=1 Tax=unclassified Hydrogenophaga TaxID=2610897 RepID=UPI0036D3AE84
MLELQGVRGGYGRINILDGIALRVDDGEVLGVLGHNGMGKTTLMRAIVGEIAVSAGELRWQGESIARLPTHRRVARGIGYVPQGRRIFPLLSVRENLLFAASVHGGRQAMQVVDEVLADFPALPRLLDRPGGLLSGGEQQILALARCLCTRPKLVLLDEPTEGIQPSIIEDMVLLLRSLRQRHRLSIVLVEQNLDFLRALSDRIVVLEKGRTVREARASDAAAMAALVESAEFAG